MNLTKTITLIFTIFCFSNSIYAQKQQTVPLGTKLPDLHLSKILNYSSSEVSLHSLTQKSVLLDFGTTNCAPCIATLLLLDSIQKHFINDLQVFMITYEKKDAVDRFLKKHPNLKIPIVTEDILISNYFKHKYDPHEVWIDKNKVVRAYTDHSHVSFKNIDSLVRGHKINWPVKLDLEYNIDKPLMIWNKDSLNAMIPPKRTFFKSVLTSNMPGGVLTNYKERIDSINRNISVRAINYSIIELYMITYGKLWYYDFPPSHVILETASKSKYYFDKSFGYRSTWKENNTYCYETTMPLSLSQEQRKEIITKDFNNYFGISVTFEKKRVPCWIVIVKNRDQLSNSKKLRRGVIFGNFIFEMNRVFPNPPLIDETNLPKEYKDAMILPINAETYNDIDKVRKQLLPFGLDIVIGEREIDACVVRDNNTAL